MPVPILVRLERLPPSPMLPETVRLPVPPSAMLPASVIAPETPAVLVPVSAPTPPAPEPASVRALPRVTPLTSRVAPAETVVAEEPSAWAFATLSVPPERVVVPV